MVEKKEPSFPNLRRIEEQDRELHVKKAMEAGMTREQAERHADEDQSEREREDAHR